MRTITADDAVKDFESLVKEAAQRPVKVTTNGDSHLIIMSEAEFARFTGASRRQLKDALDRVHREVAASGLSEDEIEKLLAEDLVK